MGVAAGVAGALADYLNPERASLGSVPEPHSFVILWTVAVPSADTGISNRK